jgi:hypothetical protein
MELISLLKIIGIVILTYYVARVCHILVMKFSKSTNTKQKNKRIMIILGSGGHTTEMIQILQKFKYENYESITFITAKSDKLSVQKALSLLNKYNQVT